MTSRKDAKTQRIIFVGMAVSMLVAPIMAEDLARDLGPVPPAPTLATDAIQAEAAMASADESTAFRDEHPYLYSAGWGVLISGVIYALITAIDKGGDEVVYNIGGSYNESSNNGGNGSSGSNDGDVNQSTGAGNNGR